MRTSKMARRILIVIISAIVLFGAANAQTKKKKKRAVRKPVAVKPAVQTNGDASVVSLADQYQDSSSQIIQPTPSLADTQIPLPDETAKKLKELQSRIKKLETVQPAEKKNTYEDKQKMLLTNLDILTKAEQRSESLRRQRFELVEKENSLRSRLDQIEIDSRADVIERSIAVMGTLRPEEMREARRKSLDAEKRNLSNLLNEIVATRTRLDGDVLRSDALVEKLRAKLEQDIDNALNSDQPEP